MTAGSSRLPAGVHNMGRPASLLGPARTTAYLEMRASPALHRSSTLAPTFVRSSTAASAPASGREARELGQPWPACASRRHPSPEPKPPPRHGSSPAYGLQCLQRSGTWSPPLAARQARGMRMTTAELDQAGSGQANQARTRPAAHPAACPCRACALPPAKAWPASCSPFRTAGPRPHVAEVEHRSLPILVLCVAHGGWVLAAHTADGRPKGSAGGGVVRRLALGARPCGIAATSCERNSGKARGRPKAGYTSAAPRSSTSQIDLPKRQSAL